MKKLRTNTAKPVVLQPVWPNVGVQVWYAQQLDAMINKSAAELTRQLAEAWQRTPPLFSGFAQDAMITETELRLSGATAAGIAYRAPSGRVLFMRRTDNEGWAFPGGSIEENETAEAAARREAFEETLHPVNGPVEFVHVVSHRGVRFAVFLADVLEEFTPQLNSEHDAFEWLTPLDASVKGLHIGVQQTVGLWLQSGFAQDAAPTGTKGLQAALARWGAQTIKRFDLMSETIANNFAERNQNATQRAMMAQLQKAGFAIQFKPSAQSMEAFRAVVAENVALIKSIPRKYHEQVEQKVWNAVRQGSDLHKLSTDLAKAHKVTTDRASLIARDQNAKAKATIERVRQTELGITRAIWMHSHAGKEPRPTHVAMNNTPYNLTKGMYDSDEGEWIHPGQLINCRCTNRPIIEGFE